MLNAEGNMLLRAVINRDASLRNAVKRGDCKAIAAQVNAYMPKHLQVSAANVYDAMKGDAAFKLPVHNVEAVRKRIDNTPQLYAARINSALRGEAGDGALQAIVNELNKSDNVAERVTMEDVVAAMALRVEPAPTVTAAGAAALEGKGATA